MSEREKAENFISLSLSCSKKREKSQGDSAVEARKADQMKHIYIYKAATLEIQEFKYTRKYYPFLYSQYSLCYFFTLTPKFYRTRTNKSRNFFFLSWELKWPRE